MNLHSYRAGAAKVGLSNFIAVLLGIALLVLSIVKISELTGSGSLRWSSWGYSEWLINYEGGFVRRALAGEIFRHVWLPADYLQNLNGFLATQYGLVAILLAAIFAIVIPFHRAFLLAVVLPGSLFNMALTESFFFRKEMTFTVFLSALALTACLFAKAGERYRSVAWNVSLAVSAIAFCVLSLVHEAFLFMAAPAAIYILAISAPPGDDTRSYRALIGLGALAIFLFALSCVYKGDPTTAVRIWDSIPQIMRPNDLVSATAPYAAIEHIGWSLSQGLNLSYAVWKSGLALYWLFPLFLNMIGLFVLWAIVNDRPKLELPPSLAPIFMSTIPLYVLGWDWGRWISMATIATVISMLVTLRFQPAPRQSAAPAAGADSTARVELLFWPIVLACLLTRMPECCLMMQG